MDRQTAKIITDELVAAAMEVAKRHGLTAKPCSTQYGNTGLTVKIELASVGESGVAMGRDAKAFIDYAEAIGFKPDDLGRKFDYNGKQMTLIGFRPRSRLSILGRAADGKEYRLRAEIVKRGLQR